MPNGGTAYNSTHILFCNFGDTSHPSTLSLLDPVSNHSTPLLTSFYGRNFSSINDVRINHLDGSVWFTDSYYGQLEGFRPPPLMPPQVYRFDPKTGIVNAVADRFVEPNGIEFSPDFTTLYISDSGYVLAPGDFNGTRPSSIYAFDVTAKGGLVNRRLFAYSGRPFPDGLHVDTKGNMWSSSGNGTSVWDSEGVLIGEARVDMGVNNFLFVPEGILMFAFTKLWLVTCGVRGRAFG
jgi:gluconolactonase